MKEFSSNLRKIEMEKTELLDEQLLQRNRLKKPSITNSYYA